MNTLVTVQNVGTCVWDGTTSRPIDIRRFTRFAFSLEVLADLSADVEVEFMAAPASEADPCVPGDFAKVPEVAVCDSGALADETKVVIPAGTLAGSICAFTLPCRTNAFIQLALTGPAADVRVVAVRQGPC